MTGGVVLPSKNKATHEYTLEELQNITKAGKANEYFSVGDVVGPVMLNGTVGDVTLTDYPAYFIIIGIDHLIEVEKPGYHTLTLQFGKSGLEDDAKFIALNGTFPANSTLTTEGGWAGSSLRTYCSQFKACLPTAWQEAIIPVTKYTDNVGGNHKDLYTLPYNQITSTIEEVFVVSASEQFSSIPIHANPYELVSDDDRYEFYLEPEDTRYCHNDLNVSCTYSTRTPGAYYYYSDAESRGRVYWINTNTTLTNHYTTVNTNQGFAPAFCIGGVATDSPSYSTDEYMLKSEFDTKIAQFGGTLLTEFFYNRNRDEYYTYAPNLVYLLADDYMVGLTCYTGNKYKRTEALATLAVAETVYKFHSGELTETSGKIEPILEFTRPLELSEPGDFAADVVDINYNGDGLLVAKGRVYHYDNNDYNKYDVKVFTIIKGHTFYGYAESWIYGTNIYIKAFEGKNYASKTISAYVDTGD